MLHAHFNADNYKVDEVQIQMWQREMDSVARMASMHTYRSFDPNIDPYDSLLAKGLSTRLAKSIVNYREKVKPFSNIHDMAKLYVMNSTMLEEISPYVKISERSVKDKTPAEKKYVEQFELFINSAKVKDWKKIRGIGEVLSRRIIAYKNLLGGFVQLDQIAEVYGINDSLYLSMLPYIKIDSFDIQKVNLSRADFKILIRHPYINIEQVKEILNTRKKNGPLCSLADLWSLESFDIERDRRVIPYLWFHCDPK